MNTSLFMAKEARHRSTLLSVYAMDRFMDDYATREIYLSDHAAADLADVLKVMVQYGGSSPVILSDETIYPTPAVTSGLRATFVVPNTQWSSVTIGQSDSYVRYHMTANERTFAWTQIYRIPARIASMAKRFAETDAISIVEKRIAPIGQSQHFTKFVEFIKLDKDEVWNRTKNAVDHVMNALIKGSAKPSDILPQEVQDDAVWLHDTISFLMVLDVAIRIKGRISLAPINRDRVSPRFDILLSHWDLAYIAKTQDGKLAAVELSDADQTSDTPLSDIVKQGLIFAPALPSSGVALKKAGPYAALCVVPFLLTGCDPLRLVHTSYSSVREMLDVWGSLAVEGVRNAVQGMTVRDFRKQLIGDESNSIFLPDPAAGKSVFGQTMHGSIPFVAGILKAAHNIAAIHQTVGGIDRTRDVIVMTAVIPTSVDQVGSILRSAYAGDDSVYRVQFGNGSVRVKLLSPIGKVSGMFDRLVSAVTKMPETVAKSTASGVARILAGGQRLLKDVMDDLDILMGEAQQRPIPDMWQPVLAITRDPTQIKWVAKAISRNLSGEQDAFSSLNDANLADCAQTLAEYYLQTIQIEEDKVLHPQLDEDLDVVLKAVDPTVSYALKAHEQESSDQLKSGLSLQGITSDMAVLREALDTYSRDSDAQLTIQACNAHILHVEAALSGGVGYDPRVVKAAPILIQFELEQEEETATSDSSVDQADIQHVSDDGNEAVAGGTDGN